MSDNFLEKEETVKRSYTVVSSIEDEEIQE